MNKGGSSGIYDRCLEKTPEQLFIGTLRREFEPLVCNGLVANRYFLFHCSLHAVFTHVDVV
jgi:hypothetical protein